VTQVKTIISKPWLDKNGKIFSDCELKQISKSWDEDTWNQYLTATVDKDISRYETSKKNYPDLVEESEGVWCASGRLPIEVQRRLEIIIRKLPKVQRAVIRGLYYHNFTQSEVAKNLGISQPTVNEAKKSSLNKIKNFLEVDPITASYLIGGLQKMNLESSNRGQEIFEVYLKDLKGGYIK
jgi:predicted transcriptional regulator